MNKKHKILSIIIFFGLLNYLYYSHFHFHNHQSNIECDSDCCHSHIESPVITGYSLFAEPLLSKHQADYHNDDCSICNFIKNFSFFSVLLLTLPDSHNFYYEFSFNNFSFIISSYFSDFLPRGPPHLF